MEEKPLFQLTTDELRKLMREEFEAIQSSINYTSEEEDLSELLSRKQVAEYFGVSLVTINKWVRTGVLPEPIKRGKRVFFKLTDLKKNVNNG